ncbi:hypothetical protein RBS60_02690 [Sinomonas sp. ASV486]|uniref:hypothetical protein n=1 Tax=Sinomonas sp. ASV486 TaxID=3051170 RepID=UPI0027DC5F74|nr:hypothetical protein [Sinomonas sp. ASV486]MDQ4489104.1 hypothetical protein [Sinomonas sp. ASV486]
MTKITAAELAAEAVELLPSRDTLFLDANWAGIVATNTSLAVNAATWGSVAQSAAWQSISVNQH